jgi:HAD superfamily hydrolase (TIGR01509 family)
MLRMARKLSRKKTAVAKKKKATVAAAPKQKLPAAVAIFASKTKPVPFDASKIKAVLFDADNTLFPTRDIAKDCDAEALRLFEDEGADHKQVLLAFYDIVGKLSGDDDIRKRTRSYSYALLAKKLRIKPQVAVDAAKKFRELVLSKIAPYPAARKFIEKLQKKYSARLAVVTCEEREWALEKLEAAGLMDFFDVVVTTSETRKMKPHSSYCTLACKKLKVRPADCVMVGDSEAHDLAPARKLGMHAFASDYEKLDELFP